MKRRNLLAALPAALAVGAVPAVAIASVQYDPMVELANSYIDAFRAWDAAASEPDAGNFDTPRCRELDVVKEEIESKIKVTPIASDAGFAAFCRYVNAMNFISENNNDWPDMPRWQWDKIAEWSRTREMIAA